MKPRKMVVESPLSAPDRAGIRENVRFALWCCRALELSGYDPICSHVVKPWWLDGHVPQERERGIASSWFWSGATHVFFTDLGTSRGMRAALARCRREIIEHSDVALEDYCPDSWNAFKRGEWPPHTAGFEIGGIDK